MNAADIEQIGRYRVKRFVAEGGMAWVFEVVDPTFEGFEVVRALKMLKPEAAAGEEFQRFQAEAALLAGIDHPNLVTIYDFGRDEATGCFYYTMTFIDGPTLASYRNERGGLSEDEVVRIFEEVLAGLGELHRRKIVHRDIKPANVLIGADGRPRLADLGIARVQDTSGRTRTGFALGTVNYMSPEQARGRSVGPASDVFSVGLTLYESLTGRIVYDDVEDLDSTNSHDVLGYLVHLARSGEELEIDFRAAGISPPIAEVIRKACRFDPEERYADASEMLEALRAARRGQAELVLREPRARWPWIAGGAVLVVAAVVGYYVYQSHETARVKSILDHADALQTQLTALVERSVNLDPKPDEALASSLSRSRAESQRYLKDAKDDFENQRRQAAETEATRAIGGIDDICGRLVTDYVKPLASKRMAAAQAAVDGLRIGGAEEAFPDDFKSLQALLPTEKAAAGSGCDAAGAELDRIERATTIQTKASELDARLAPWLVTTVDEARDRALGAATRAKADRVDAPPFTTALTNGKTALQHGDDLRGQKDLRGARAAYQQAVTSYETAAAIAPASRARADALAVERQLDAQGVPPKPETSRILTTAHELYQDQRWQEATQEFQTAKARMAEDLDRGAAIAEANAMREAASSRRTEAVKAGAERSAGRELTDADAALREGATALANEKISDAMSDFQKAERLFATARDASARALEDAREAQRAAQREIQPCPSLDAPAARTACDDAQAALERGNKALAGLDAPAASQAFGDVPRGVQAAREEQARYAAANQVPPDIVSFTPDKSQIEAHRNQRIKFSVAAEDKNGDAIHYEWSFEGNRLPDTGSTLQFPPQRNGALQVAVIDAQGGRTTQRWLVQLLNTPPVATLEPDAHTVDVSVGGYRTFRASVHDPDGDAVDSVWKLDGKQVATGTRYRFDAGKEGRHELEFVATDGGGERSLVRRTIEVKPAPKRAPAPRPVFEPEPKPAPKPTVIAEAPRPAAPPQPKPASVSRIVQGVKMPSDLAISGDQRDGVAIALGRYCSAIEAKNLADLENVFIGMKMDPSQSFRWSTRYKSLFRSRLPISVSVNVKTGYQSGKNSVTLTLSQTEKRGERERSYNYKMTLLKRDTTNEWQITKVQ